MDQRVATALLSYLTQTAYQAGQALQDARLDGHDAEILALQNAGPFATAGDLSNLQVTLQSAIDGILAEIATLGGATNLVNAPAWVGNVTWDLLAGTNQIRNLHATGPLSIQLANDDWTLSFGCDAYTTQQTDDAIAAALTNYFTRAEVTVTVVAAIDESKAYTDTQLADYSTTTQMTQAITDALVPYGKRRPSGTPPSRQARNHGPGALQHHGPDGQPSPSRWCPTAVARDAQYLTTPLKRTPRRRWCPTGRRPTPAIAAALVSVTLSNGQNWNGGPTFNLLRGSNVLRNLSVAGALTASFQNLDDTILIESDSYARSETYTQAETGAAITAAIDALDLSQFQERSAGPGPHRHGPGALLGPNGGLDLRGGRAGQLRHQQLGDLGHQLGFVELRQQLPGRFQDRHGSAGLLHADRSGSADRRRPGQRGSLELLHAGRDAELRGQRAARVLSPHRAGLPAHGHAHPILDRREPKRRSTMPSPARAS